MDSTWSVGPFVIQEKWGLYAASAAISYVMLRTFVKKKKLDAHVFDVLWNGFFIFLIVWKISYALFHPLHTFQHPLSLLYFSGGDKGVILGIIAATAYFAWKSSRSSFLFAYYIEMTLFTVLIAFGSYRLFVWLFYSFNDFKLLLTALLPFAILYYLLKSKDRAASLFLFSLAEIGIFFKKNNGFMFAWELVFHSAAALICLFLLAIQSKATIKKLIPIVLLGSLILWAGYDFFGADSVQLKQERAEETGVLKGDRAPDFTLASLTGEEVRLSDFRGKRVILNFWAAWCPPCRAEMPHMQKYYEDFHEDDNVVIVGVNVTATERHPDIVRSFVNENGITFPILLDEKREVTSEYEVVAYPTSFFIDEWGTIQSKIIGPMDREQMQKHVRNMNR